MPMLDLNDVRLFAQIVESGGFSAAARVLGRPKSTLSSRVARLEAHLGVRLIQRTSRRFATTEIGREFHRHASAMLTEATAAEDAVLRHVAEPVGAVRLTSSIGTSQAGLGTVLVEFARAFPKVTVHLHTTNRAVDLIDEGYDLAVRAHELPLPDSELVQRKLGFSPRWLVAARSYLAARGWPHGPCDLAGHDALHISDATGPEWKLVAPDGSELDVRPRRRLSSDDHTVLRAASLAGLGIAALPVGLCYSDVKAGSLIRILEGWYVGGAHISVLTPHRRGQLPSVKALSEFIASHLPTAMKLENL
jgi:DNA-binding transcriptional LysR family regulator